MNEGSHLEKYRKSSIMANCQLSAPFIRSDMIVYCCPFPNAEGFIQAANVRVCDNPRVLLPTMASRLPSLGSKLYALPISLNRSVVVVAFTTVPTKPLPRTSAVLPPVNGKKAISFPATPTVTLPKNASDVLLLLS